MKIVILAAGIGSRLGNPLPKPITKLNSGQSIMAHQMETFLHYFGANEIYTVVGFKKDLIMEQFPDAYYVYNQNYDRTNTSKSLLKAISKFSDTSVLWVNGDVLFEPHILDQIKPLIEKELSFAVVNTSDVGDEEVKYSLKPDGKHIQGISKEVKDGLGEALGINFISKHDLEPFKKRLAECPDQAYFEKAIEMAIEKDNVNFLPVDISNFKCIEIDFETDLIKANELFG